MSEDFLGVFFMSTAVERDAIKRRARKMLSRGTRCSVIANIIGVSDNVIHMALREEDEEWNLTAGLGEIALHAQVKVIQMLRKMGLSCRRIGDLIGLSAKYVSSLSKKDATYGHPIAILEVTAHVKDRDGQSLTKNVPYRTSPSSHDDMCVMIAESGRDVVHFVPYQNLVTKMNVIKLLIGEDADE